MQISQYVEGKREYMYKILHLFRIEKFTESFIEFVNEYFGENMHEFWVYGNRYDYPYVKVSGYKNVKYYLDILEELQTNNTKKFDKIIYHGIFETDIIKYFFQHRSLLNKLYLYFWGGDKFIHGNYMEKFRKKNLVKYAHAVINIIPEEEVFMRKTYQMRGKHFIAKYNNSELVKEMQSNMESNVQNKDYTAILIGNSSTVSNRHIPIMEALSNFKNENIKIFVPLSYGDRSYAKQVIEIGDRLFGSKFIALTKYMNKCDYLKFLREIDIGIFGIRRQQAMGNIGALLYMGKKVYLSRNSVLDHYYTKICNCNIEKTEKIDNMSFAELVEFDEDKKSNNKNMMEDLFRVGPRVRAWRAIFEDTIN